MAARRRPDLHREALAAMRAGDAGRCLRDPRDIQQGIDHVRQALAEGPDLRLKRAPCRRKSLSRRRASPPPRLMGRFPQFEPGVFGKEQSSLERCHRWRII
jgi:hypothetical protein